jgi:general stress protein YciG
MPGTPEGAAKTRQKNLEKDPNFYANIGKKSWNDPQRSRTVGFALLDKEELKEISQKGGSKTKKDYKTNPIESEEISSEVS